MEILSSAMQSIAIKVSPPIKYGIATSTFYVGLDAGVGLVHHSLGYLLICFHIVKSSVLWPL